MLELAQYAGLNGWWNGMRFHWYYLSCGYNDKLHGIEIIYYSDGSVGRLVHWHNDNRHGMNISYFKGSITHISHWRYSHLHGIEVNYANGSIQWLTNWRYGQKLN